MDLSNFWICLKIVDRKTRHRIAALPKLARYWETDWWNNGITNESVDILRLPLLGHQIIPLHSKTFIDLCLLLPQELEEEILWPCPFFCFQLGNPPPCPVCQAEEETLQHILLQCTIIFLTRGELREKLQPDRTIEQILTVRSHLLETDQPWEWDTMCRQHYLILDACTKK